MLFQNKIALLTLGVLFALGNQSQAATCAGGSLATYIGASCEAGNLSFSNFAYASAADPASKAVPATGIWVTPDFSPGDEGLQFSSGWSVSGHSFLDSLISFTVSTVDNSWSITDMELSFNGAHVAGGTTSVTETYCLTGSLTGCAEAQQLLVTNPPLALNDHIAFDGVASLSVSKDIILSADSHYDHAYISSVTDKFSQTNSVPEPATLGLIGSALILLGVKLRRR